MLSSASGRHMFWIGDGLLQLGCLSSFKTRKSIRSCHSQLVLDEPTIRVSANDFKEEYPYLVAMITYSRIGAKVWRQVAHFGPVLARDLRSTELENVDQELLQWYEQIPEEVKVRNWDKEKHITSTPSYNLQRLRIWTYLRLNQVSVTFKTQSV
jgi:hypothetical protein